MLNMAYVLKGLKSITVDFDVNKFIVYANYEKISGVVLMGHPDVHEVKQFVRQEDFNKTPITWVGVAANKALFS